MIEEMIKLTKLTELTELTELAIHGFSFLNPKDFFMNAYSKKISIKELSANEDA